MVTNFFSLSIVCMLLYKSPSSIKGCTMHTARPLRIKNTSRRGRKYVGFAAPSNLMHSISLTTLTTLSFDKQAIFFTDTSLLPRFRFTALYMHRFDDPHRRYQLMISFSLQYRLAVFSAAQKFWKSAVSLKCICMGCFVFVLISVSTSGRQDVTSAILRSIATHPLTSRKHFFMLIDTFFKNEQVMHGKTLIREQIIALQQRSFSS
jgi:hypothetical protein